METVDRSSSVVRLQVRDHRPGHPHSSVERHLESHWAQDRTKPGLVDEIEEQGHSLQVERRVAVEDWKGVWEPA